MWEDFSFYKVRFFIPLSLKLDVIPVDTSWHSGEATPVNNKSVNEHFEKYIGLCSEVSQNFLEFKVPSSPSVSCLPMVLVVYSIQQTKVFQTHLSGNEEKLLITAKEL